MHVGNVTLHYSSIKRGHPTQCSWAMGLFNKIRAKIQSAEDKLVVKMTDDFYNNTPKPETEREKKMKEHHLQMAAKQAHKLGQPATILDNGNWFIIYPDGRREPLGSEGETLGPGAQNPPKN